MLVLQGCCDKFTILTNALSRWKFRIMNKSVWWMITTGFMAILLVNCTHGNSQQGVKETEINRSTDTMALTKSWQSPISNIELPMGMVSLSAAECGKCHVEVYEEWKMSTHAHAWVDLQYQAELKKNNNLFICINCHLPLQNQQEEIVTGILDGDYFQPVKHLNAFFDPVLQQEGVTCLGCHIKNGNVIGANPDVSPPHNHVVDKEYLSETLCLGCHNAAEQISDELICTFETGDEWKAGPFSKAGINCIGCHMPEIKRQLITGPETKRGFRHFFPGSGIPKVKDETVKGLLGYSFVPVNLKEKYAVGDQVELSLKVRNDFAGHKVPTGDPERFFMIRFFVKDSHGKQLMQKEFRIGEEWEWYPMAKKISDSNILPGAAQEFSTTYEITAPQKLVWKTVVSRHRISKESLRYHHLEGIYPDSILVYEKEKDILVE